jgi:IS30 family transposase
VEITPVPKGYRQLTYDLRCQIYALKKSGQSNRAIARQLGVHSRTIDREIARNSGKRGYRYKQAESKCQERRHHKTYCKLTPERVAQIEEKLALQWSPEQIAGWLERQYGFRVISHETIYHYIWADKASGGKLYMQLRRRAKKYQKRVNGKTTRGQIKDRVGIEHRPAQVETRTALGHWEGDTIVGKNHQGAIVSLVERKTRYTVLSKVERSTAEAVKTAVTVGLKAFKVNTLTFDNGKEFAQHQEIAKTLNTAVYFARPYHSWERGTNENTNGLVRQYLPKKTDFATVTDEAVEHIAYLLNTRPRKCLGWKTPMEVIHQAA